MRVSNVILLRQTGHWLPWDIQNMLSAHVVKTAHTAEKILTTLGYPDRVAELAKIAGYMHDIGNVVNRIDHAQSGAILAFRLLDNMGDGRQMK
ncbi:MAG: HD domain-containing protein [Odoribacter sp.]